MNELSSMTIDEESVLLKVILLGEPGVGKTWLWRTYCNLSRISVPDEPRGSVGVDFANRTFTVGNHKVTVLVHDTPGRENYTEGVIGYVRNCNAVILVYDATRIETYERLFTRWKKELSKAWLVPGEHPASPEDPIPREEPACPVPVLVVSNKGDLVDQDEKLRCISDEAAYDACSRYEWFHIELSSLGTNERVNRNLRNQLDFWFGSTVFAHRVAAAAAKQAQRGPSSPASPENPKPLRLVPILKLPSTPRAPSGSPRGTIVSPASSRTTATTISPSSARADAARRVTASGMRVELLHLRAQRYGSIEAGSDQSPRIALVGRKENDLGDSDSQTDSSSGSSGRDVLPRSDRKNIARQLSSRNMLASLLPGVESGASVSSEDGMETYEYDRPALHIGPRSGRSAPGECWSCALQ